MSLLRKVALPLAGMLLALPSFADEGNKFQTQIESAKMSGLKFAQADLFTHSVGLDAVHTKGRWNAYEGAASILADATFTNIDSRTLATVHAAAPEYLQLSIPFSKSQSGTLDLELFKVNIFTHDFSVETSAPTPRGDLDYGHHYRGVVAGDARSVVAVSVFRDEFMMFADSTEHGNVMAGRMEGSRNNDYVVYADDDMTGIARSMECGMEQDAVVELPKPSVQGSSRGAQVPLERPKNLRQIKAAGDCVRIYLEADYNIYQNKGSVQATTNWVTGVYNQVGALYSSDNIETSLSQAFIWNSPSPYTSSSNTGTLLSQFQSNRSSFNGDLGHLMKLGGVSGVAAGFSGICASNRANSQSVAFVESTYQNVPNFSLTVFVVAHELGHTFGSRHTHACVWNGNNTAIDSCSGFTEGNCSLPGLPSGGGTIMSYCPGTSVGVDFNQAFNPQPNNTILGKIASASCLQASCGGGGGGGGGGGAGVLSNGVPKTGLSGSQGSQAFYTMDVPSNASNLSFETSGGSGDADLYVRFGAAPTTSTYDCRPYRNGNNETCSFASPSTGTYHVMVRGYSAFSGMSLEGSFSTGSNPNSCVGNCGGQAPGGCWCDSACANYGDCCTDKVPVCG